MFTFYLDLLQIEVSTEFNALRLIIVEEEDVQGVQWVPKAKEVATGVAMRYLDFVSKAHVDSS
jgi:hypothetical protein